MWKSAKGLLPLFLLGAHWLLLGADPAVVRQQLWRHRVVGKALFENPATRKEAVDELRQAVRLAPGSAQDRLNYGLALLRAGELAPAAGELEKAQRKTRNSPTPGSISASLITG